jgi:hypothetical protein
VPGRPARRRGVAAAQRGDSPPKPGRSIDAYLAKYPAAAERIARRGAHATLMPNLPLSRDEIVS